MYVLPTNTLNLLSAERGNLVGPKILSRLQRTIGFAERDQFRQSVTFWDGLGSKKRTVLESAVTSNEMKTSSTSNWRTQKDKIVRVQEVDLV